MSRGDPFQNFDRGAAELNLHSLDQLSQESAIQLSELYRLRKGLPLEGTHGSLTGELLREKLGIPTALHNSALQDPLRSAETLRTISRVTALINCSREPLVVVGLIGLFFPEEVKNLLGGGDVSPEGKATDTIKYSSRLLGLEQDSIFSGGALQNAELDRSLVGVVSLLQLLNGDWDLLRECQKTLPEFLRLSDASCAEMQQFILQTIDGDLDVFHGIIAVGFILDLNLKYVLSNDAGKMFSVVDELRKTIQGQPEEALLDTVDHDKILHLALKHTPHRFPSYQALPQELKDRWVDAMRVTLNPAQLNQGENLPVSIDRAIFEVPLKSLQLRCIETIGDMFGSRGHEIQNGSITMIEPVCKGLMSTLKTILKCASTELPPELPREEAISRKQLEVYKGVLEGKNQLLDWGLEIDHPLDFAVARLCASARAENREQATIIKQSLLALGPDTTSSLVNHLSKTGLEDLGIWVEYQPALLVNAARYYSNTGLSKIDSLSAACATILPAIERLLSHVRSTIAPSLLNSPGEFIINAKVLAEIALTNPESLITIPFTLETKNDGAFIRL
jgi:hypothetical protein